MYGKEEYFKDYPALTETFADFLLNVGVNMVGFDTPSPDRYPFIIHKRFLKANILIVENLTNLEPLLEAEKFEVYVSRLKSRLILLLCVLLPGYYRYGLLK